MSFFFFFFFGLKIVVLFDLSKLLVFFKGKLQITLLKFGLLGLYTPKFQNFDFTL